jgi:hypothetical protein
MIMHFQFRLASTFVIACALLIGCATEGTSIPIGTQKYPVTNPDDIAILVAPPEKTHTVVALVEGVASTDDYLSKARTQAAALAAMKKEAAKLGANAIVLTARGSAPYAQTIITNGSVGGSATAAGNTAIGSGYYTGTSTMMGWEKIQVQGTAIRYTD